MFRLTLATRLALSMFLLAGWTATTGAADNAQLTQREDPYFLQAQAQLQQRLKQTPNTNRAKNVILVVGDGMGFSTVTAARIFEGQQRGVDGESNVLAWEAFPYLAAAKTYSADAQITDSAPSAVAMTTGAVTTATITHATPGATYAHIANRDWESDAKMPANALAAGCRDIARQLVEMKYGNGLNVAMGGGRANFLPDSVSDPEYPGKKGARKDGRDLTQAWLQRYGERGQYVWNQAQFNKIEPGNVDHLLALFEPSHMNFEHDRRQDAAGEPSLAEMAGKAIDILSRNPEGYLLLVEGGRVDHGSHNGNAYRTLSDAVALNEAVKTIVDKVDLDDTLVIVTGDHSHTLTIAGYAKHGNPILGISVGVDGKPRLGSDGKPYTTLGFANGPGGAIPLTERPALTMEQTTAPDFIQPALVPLNSETHGGEDLGIYAIGPWAHLFQGTVEENYTFHVMNYASRIGERLSKR
ncbi:alkaline phosphatase [Serratia sp. CY85251]|uniref:alkaline phosphatase n=1 Tax=Serratia sp. CY85251 TaxID=3383696 RepID=UPI003FA0215F